MSAAADQVSKFAVGDVLTIRSMGDWECIFRFTVISRTASFVTLDDGHGPRRCGVKVRDGAETCYPLGRYSMAPMVTATRFRNDDAHTMAGG